MMQNTSLEQTKQSEHIPWRPVIAAIASISSVGTCLGLSIPLLSVVMEKSGYSSGLIGANVAVAGLAAIVGAALAPKFAARIGVPFALVSMAVVSAISLMLLYLIRDIVSWFILRAILNLAVTIMFVLSEFWITASTPEKKRGFVLGIYASVLSLGFALGPLLFAWLGSDGPETFYVGAALILLACIPVGFAWQQSSKVEDSSPRNILNYIWLVPAATAAVMVFGAVETGGFALFPVYAKILAMPEWQIGVLISMIGFGNVALQIPLGLLSDRVSDRRYVLIGCAMIGFIGIALLPLVIHSMVLSAMLLFIWGGSVAGLYTIGLAHLGSRLAPNQLANGNAAFVLCYGIGMLIGPQITGVTMDIVGPNGFSWSLCVFFLAYLGLLTLRLRN